MSGTGEMWNNVNSYKKGIFWCCKQPVSTGEMHYIIYYPILVYCDDKGNALEEIEIIYSSGNRIKQLPTPQYSSKKGDNFNHKIEWERHTYHKDSYPTNKHPFNYYPRGRIEIHNGKIKIFASPIIVATPGYREAVCAYYQLNEYRNDITWIADNSAHYQYETEECDHFELMITK